MAKDTFTGPVISLGGLAGGVGGLQPREYSDELGPSIFWGGTAIPSSSGPASKDRMGPGAIASVFCASPIRTLNSTPGAGGAAAGITISLQNAVAGVPFPNLITYPVNGGRAPAVPVIGSNGLPTTGVGLDMGLDLATFATTGTVTLTGTSAGNAWRYRAGQWIGLLNGGVSAATQFTQIVSIAGAVLTVSPAPLANANGQTAITNRYNPNLYGASGPPSGLSSTMSAGTARILIPGGWRNARRRRHRLRQCDWRSCCDRGH